MEGDEEGVGKGWIARRVEIFETEWRAVGAKWRVRGGNLPAIEFLTPEIEFRVGENTSAGLKAIRPAVILSTLYRVESVSRITKILKESRGRCAEFIASLINGTSTERNSPEFTDILEGFDLVRGQRNFIYGDTIKKVYGVPGATVRGSISGRDAQVELPQPWVGNNPTKNAAIIASQTRIELLAVMHELIHLAGKRGFDDFQLASTVAAMKGYRPPDYSGLTPTQAVLKASYSWTETLSLACKPR